MAQWRCYEKYKINQEIRVNVNELKKVSDLSFSETLKITYEKNTYEMQLSLLSLVFFPMAVLCGPLSIKAQSQEHPRFCNNARLGCRGRVAIRP